MLAFRWFCAAHQSRVKRSTESAATSSTHRQRFKQLITALREFIVKLHQPCFSVLMALVRFAKLRRSRESK
jgi:hypothetical protein